MDDGQGSQAESANVADNVTGPVVQARDVAGNLVLNVGRQALPVARVPRELPLDVADFAGREEELAELDRLREQSSGAVVISAVSGTAGVGKTALAVHWAHRVRGAYPDGDLYIDLRGYDPNQPVSPEEALGELLRSLVGSAEPVPSALSDRSRLFRTLVAERRMLIVLDNARSVEQVRPLLPGAGSTFVLVTSRDSLSGLVVRDGASRVHLGLLEPDEAFGLFSSLVGKRAQAEPEAVRQLCEWSTHLPLALRITAEMVNARPGESLTALLAELAGADRLDLMEAGDERTAVRTVFSWSYRHLSPAAARAFRCLAIAPGRDVDARAVAALTGVADARKAVTELERAHLVQPVGNGRVHAHDLLRSYAADLFKQTDDDRDAALARLFHYYVTAACRAIDVALPNRRSGWHIDEIETPCFADSEAAWRWLREEQPNLAATLAALDLVGKPARPAAGQVPAAADLAGEPGGLGAGQVPAPPSGVLPAAGDLAGEPERSAAEQVPAPHSSAPHSSAPSAAADLARASTRSAAEQVLGLLAQHRGDLPAALAHFERAWCLTPDAGHALWLDQVDTLLAAGMPNKASVYLNDVLDLLHSARMADDRLIAQVEHVRAQCALLQSDFKCAREAAWEAATRFRRVCDERAAVVAELTTLRATMSLARAWRDRSAAKLLAFAEKLSRQLDELNLTDESDQALLWAARLSVSFGDVDAAQRYVARTAAPRDGAPLDHVVFRWLVMAELAAEQGEVDDALDCASSGLDRLLAAFDRYGATDLVRGAGLFGRELGDLAVRLALKRGDGPEALLTWLERSRAHLHRHQPATSPDPAVSEAVDDFIRLARTMQQQRVNGPVEADLAQRHEIALRRVSHLGWWSTTCVGSDALVSVGELSDALEDKAFVSFVVSGDALAAVVVADGAEHLVPLGRSSVMTEQARQLHFDLAAMAPDLIPERVGNVIAYSARNRLTSLDVQLIRPLLPIIGDRDLVVVPVGQLYGVPWGGLPSLVGRPVVVAPSATAWFRALTAARAERPGQALLVVGPGVGAAAEDERLARLHRNAVTIGSDDASLTAVHDALRTSDFVHLACHGRHEPDNALFSRLELADAPLHAHDFGRLDRTPRQVVLAACGLALTDIRPGDELLGFAGALLSVGTSTVVVAVSSVGELAARTAMEEFHRGVLSGATAAAALAAAVAGDPLRRPFICVGADSVLSSPVTTR